MKWIRGETFDLTLKSAPRAVLLRHLRDACRALHFAHERGVIHRDLKPTNLMTGELGELYVLDWGLAKLRNDPEEIDRPIQDASGAVATREGSVLGTIGYMAPEQLRGDTDVDARADVYSLGPLLYEALAGAPLHGGSKAKAALSLLKTDGARPGETDPSREISAGLDFACYHATRVDPADRFADAATLAAHLDRALSEMG
ncbi:MAG: serine/threonine-protein kinase [Sandaracinaceae bacterium]